MRIRNEKGSVLVIALVMLALLTIIGIMATNLAQTEIQIAGNHYRHTQAFYHAEAGANLAMAVAKDRVKALKSTNNWGSWTDPDTFVNTTYSVPDSLMQFSVSITPKRNSSGNIVLWGDTNNDAKCEENLTTGYPILTIRSTGMAPGGAMAVVEVLARINVTFAKVPGPLYGTDGISRTGVSMEAYGDEEVSTYTASTDCADIDVTGIKDVVTDVGTAAAVEITAAHICDASQDICGSTKLTSDTGPKYPISQVIDNLKLMAVQITSPLDPSDPTTVKLTNPTTLGSPTEPGLFYCDRNLVLAANAKITVYGTLMVAGNLECNGGIGVEGLVFVKGTTYVNGGATDVVRGAFLGEGAVSIKGNPKFYYDCTKLQSVKNKYEQYRMLAWMTD